MTNTKLENIVVHENWLQGSGSYWKYMTPAFEKHLLSYLPIFEKYRTDIGIAPTVAVEGQRAEAADHIDAFFEKHFRPLETKRRGFVVHEQLEAARAGGNSRAAQHHMGRRTLVHFPARHVGTGGETFQAHI